MNKIHFAAVLCLMVSLGSMAIAAQNVPGPAVAQGWPFGDEPQAESATPMDDFLITVGSSVHAPGVLVSSDLGISFRVDPFFTDSLTQMTALPAFGMTQSLETGIAFDWWTASVDINLSLSPWSLTSTGGWLELHPPQWVILTSPWLTVDGSVGWGPRWVPAAEWSHTLGGVLDVQADWMLNTLWGSMLELISASNLDLEWTFPNGAFVTSWMIQLDARSILPVFTSSRAALRAGVRAQIAVLPAFGLGFDVRLEFRAEPFTAYGLIGAGGAGIWAEAGFEWSIGWSMSGGLD